MLTKEEFLRTYYGGSLLHKLVDHEATFRCVTSKDGILDKDYNMNGIINCSLDNMIDFCFKVKKELIKYKDAKLTQRYDNDESIDTSLTYTKEESDEDFAKRQNKKYDAYVKHEQDKLRVEEYKKEQEQLAQEYKDKLNTLKRKYGA